MGVLTFEMLPSYPKPKMRASFILSASRTLRWLLEKWVFAGEDIGTNHRINPKANLEIHTIQSTIPLPLLTLSPNIST